MALLLLPEVDAEEAEDAEEDEEEEAMLEDADEPPEPAVSLLVEDALLLDELLDRAPPLRATDVVMEVPPPELSKLTDRSCRCPNICGAFREA
ncbi:MAG: hypothetical protein LLG20_12155 [Acidobacteriales bacterium]|nr:hypothetical protein [Terriglobales bacterium]